jgi:rhodanese-related sulfurtransferase
MAEPQAEAAEHELAPERVAEMAQAGDAQLVDVRTAPEHDAGHVAGDRHIPLDQVPGAVGALDGDRPVVFYCRVGERSALAAEAFRASGWEAYTMSGGLVSWTEKGLPLEPESGEVAHHSALPDD